MRVSYSKGQRDIAKKENKRLFTIAFTGKGGKGGVTTQGICDDVNVGKISDLVMESFNWESDKA